jgi:AbrB family looped-hinge helix DNA binding protein
MAEVLVSTKYQVVIPKEVRSGFGIKPGQKLSCIAKGGIIYLIPSRPIQEMRGFLKAKTPWQEDLREKKDRY